MVSMERNLRLLVCLLGVQFTWSWMTQAGANVRRVDTSKLFCAKPSNSAADAATHQDEVRRRLFTTSAAVLAASLTKILPANALESYETKRIAVFEKVCT